MTGDLGHERVKELAPELALDIATGEERHAALRHLSTCAECRQLVSELSSIGEELLLLAPPSEPPPGFESRVLAAVAEPTAPQPLMAGSRTKRVAAALALAAALVFAAALGGGSVFLATGDDRLLAESYRDVLIEGHGSFFAATSLQGSDGEVGTVFGYEGRPSWIIVTLRAPFEAEQEFLVHAHTRDGDSISLGTAILGGEREAWGRDLPVDLSALSDVRFVGPDGRTVFVAAFSTRAGSSAGPWE